MRPRLWPAAVIILAGAAWVLRTWLFADVIRQARIVQTIATVALVGLGLTIWLALFSRLPARVRWSGVGVVVGLGLVCAALFRVRGLTGDLVPVLEPRWSRSRAPQPVVAAPSATSPASVEVASTPPPAAGEPPAATPMPAASAPAVSDWPQFQGPHRNATLAAPRLAADWSASPPRLVWRQPVGEGWSGFAVARGLAVTQEQHEDQERVVALDLATGRTLWTHADPVRYDTVIAGVGPRATPTVAGGRVFTQGATGILNAFDLASGRRLWRHDVVGENAAMLPEWGKSGSPLVVDGRVIVSAGGGNGRSLVAYDAATGEPAWAAGSDGASYSSPVLLTLAGRPQIVIVNRGSVAGHDPTSGVLLWETPFPPSQPNVATPLPMPGDRLLVSVGYGVGSKAYRLTGSGGAVAPALLWESPRLKSKFANLVWHQGFVYGLDDGVLTCLDPETGERRWKGGRYGHGQLLLVGSMLLVQSEDGELVLVDPTPEAHRERARFAALDGKTWNPPALAGRLLLVRNEREAAAYELPVE